jgi:hypothetical protein
MERHSLDFILRGLGVSVMDIRVRNKARLGKVGVYGDRRTGSLSCRTKPIPGCWLYKQTQLGPANRAKQSQFPAVPGGAKPERRGCDCAKQSQTWAGHWSLWGMARGEPIVRNEPHSSIADCGLRSEPGVTRFGIADWGQTCGGTPAGGLCKTNPICGVSGRWGRSIAPNKPNWDPPIVPNKANCRRYRVGQTGGAWVRLCKTKPNLGKSGHSGGWRTGSLSCKTKPIAGGGWLYKQTQLGPANRAKQTQLPPVPGGAKPERRWCDCAKQSQTWARWDIWGRARGGACCAKRTQFGPGGRCFGGRNAPNEPNLRRPRRFTTEAQSPQRWSWIP